MINLTGQLEVTACGEQLDRYVRQAFQIIRDYLTTDSPIPDNKSTWRANGTDDYERAILFYFDPECFDSRPFTEAFVQAVFEYAGMNSSTSGASDRFSALQEFTTYKTPPNAQAINGLQTQLKLFLILLWCLEAVRIPLNFLIDSASQYGDLYTQHMTEVAKFFSQYPNLNHRPANAPAVQKSGPSAIRKYGFRLLLATDWHCIEDVSIFDMAAAHKALLAAQRGDNPLNLTTSKIPFQLMLNELLVCFSARTEFDRQDLNEYAKWIAVPLYRTRPFEEYLMEKEDIDEERKLRHQAKIDRGHAYWNLVRQSGGYTAPKHQSDLQERLTELAEFTSNPELRDKGEIAMFKEYFSRIRGIRRDGINWLSQGAPWPGREHVDLPALSKIWMKVIQAYLSDRRDTQEFETEKQVVQAINHLCDYIFLICVWWKELHPDSPVPVPLSPKDFKRAWFVKRTTSPVDSAGQPIALPVTFYELLRVRMSNDARYHTIQYLSRFFAFIRDEFAHDDTVAGEGYSPPIVPDDRPKNVKRRGKTNKVPFNKNTYPALLFYSYCVESFGEYLQQLALENDHDLFAEQQARAVKFFDAAQWGYIPVFWYRDKLYRVEHVPNVFSFAERLFDIEGYCEKLKYKPVWPSDTAEDLKKTPTRKIWLPHITILRMLIGAEETGLRLQSLQWLDYNEWDKLNRLVLPIYDFNLIYHTQAATFLPVVISTDKSKDAAWVVHEVFRVRALFYRESRFRDHIAEACMNIKVWYEGREHSRFGQILPLFRSSEIANPFSDSAYSLYWTHLLWGFEEFYNNQIASQTNGTPQQFVYIGKKELLQPVPAYDESVKPTHIRAINTPHSCRATYVTNRKYYLETSDIARQVGHEHEIQTYHYMVSIREDLQEELTFADQVTVLSGLSERFDPRNPGYIRADKPDSALVQSFIKDRERTIETFGFAPSVALWKLNRPNPPPLEHWNC